MTKLDYMRLERIENRFDRNHPGRHLAKCWFEEVQQLSDIFYWLWSTEINKPSLELFRDTYGVSFQMDDVQPEMDLWCEKRQESWIEEFWSWEWDQGRRITGTFYQHPNDPPVPSETETSHLFGVLLASIPTEVFAWARFHKKVWSRSYEKRYMKHRELMDIVVEYSVDDLLRIEGCAHYWRGKLGPQRPEDIRMPTWGANVKLYGHGPTEKTYPEYEFYDHYANRTITAYENWVDGWKMIEKVIEADRQEQIHETDDV